MLLSAFQELWNCEDFYLRRCHAFVDFGTRLSSIPTISASVTAANLFDEGLTFDISQTQLKSPKIASINHIIFGGSKYQ